MLASAAAANAAAAGAAARAAGARIARRVLPSGSLEAAGRQYSLDPFERESRTGVEPRWGCRALELGSYKGIRYKEIVRLRKTQPNKEN